MNRSRALGVALFASLLAAEACAQEGVEAVAKKPQRAIVPAVTSKPSEGAPTSAPKAAAATEIYAQIDQDEVELRCFATDLSPAYGEKLTRGEVIKVGEADGAYRRVILPLGVLGYVHHKFLSQLDGGKLVSTAAKLAFRRRPFSHEAPVRFVDRGTEFLPLGEEGEWWKVRFPGGSAWVPETDLILFPDGGEVATLEAAYKDLGRRQHQEVDAAVAVVHQRLVEAAAKVAREEKLQDLQQGFSAELSKPRSEREFSAIATELDQLIGELDAEGSLYASAVDLQAAIEKDEYYRKVQEVIAEPVKPAVVEQLVTPIVPDPLARFDATGWLHYDSGGLNREPSLRLEKAGQLILMLTCSSSRYNLRQFDSMEVGLNGPRRRAHEMALRTMDVERIEILGGPPQR